MEDTYPLFHPFWARFDLAQLRTRRPNASKKVLTENFRELEDAGSWFEETLAGLFRHVEYDFSEAVRPRFSRCWTTWPIPWLGRSRRRKASKRCLKRKIWAPAK